ncbi:MAG: hypothetical protein P8Q99_14445 [Paracoccaceae bacterium]|jgi:hypothetical protein|nr:hypothetical protein RB2150_03549 [Rhodobacterales bacterium HTCC2150] [Rhodobacteraceae bacterium HTCC2150]MDG1532536.1 hypothetical protein [Paracoccaceae bacterium]
MERIISMVIRQVINRVVRIGVTKGIDVVADNMPKRGNQTEEEQANAKKQAKDIQGRARQTIKMGRRMKF